MNVPSTAEFLLAPWSSVGVISRILLAIQFVAALAGFVPSVRQRLRGVPWFVAALVGPPLLWILCATSFDLLLIFEGFFHFSLQYFLNRLLNLPLIIGTTLLLQIVLAYQYAPRRLLALPLPGIAFALLAIGGMPLNPTVSPVTGLAARDQGGHGTGPVRARPAPVHPRGLSAIR